MEPLHCSFKVCNASRALEHNGLDYADIRIPGINAWETVETSLWEPNLEYEEWTVVEWEGQFYALKRNLYHVLFDIRVTRIVVTEIVTLFKRVSNRRHCG